MKSFKIIGLSVAATILSAGISSAAVIDFTDTDFTEQGVADDTKVTSVTGEFAYVSGYSFNGINITGTAPSAYLDAYSGGLPGGLGVCKVLGTVGGTADQCDPKNDDNITTGEAVGINFGTGTLNSVTFRGDELGGDDTHALLASGSSFLWSLNGFSWTQSFVSANGIWQTGGLELSNRAGIFFATDLFELYIAKADYEGGDPDGGPTPAPIPAAGLMLLTALGGLGFARRKRAKKA